VFSGRVAVADDQPSTTARVARAVQTTPGTLRRWMIAA